jgi:hypothetical protein
MAHPYQELIQHHSERIHIRTRVDIPARGIGLLRTHVTYGPDDDSQIAMNDGLLMRALHVVANLDEQLQPLAYGYLMNVAS